MKITPEHHKASFARAQGLSYAELADRLGCTLDQARQLVHDFCRVMTLQLNAEYDKPGGVPDDPASGS